MDGRDRYGHVTATSLSGTPRHGSKPGSTTEHAKIGLPRTPRKGRCLLCAAHLCRSTPQGWCAHRSPCEPVHVLRMTQVAMRRQRLTTTDARLQERPLLAMALAPRSGRKAFAHRACLGLDPGCAPTLSYEEVVSRLRNPVDETCVRANACGSRHTRESPTEVRRQMTARPAFTPSCNGKREMNYARHAYPTSAVAARKNMFPKKLTPCQKISRTSPIILPSPAAGGPWSSLNTLKLKDNKVRLKRHARTQRRNLSWQLPVQG